MTNTYSTNRAAVTIRNFYPHAVNLKDRKVLVLGGGTQAYGEILRLVDAGCFLTIIALHTSPELCELAITHASRAQIVALSPEAFLESAAGKNLQQFELAFLLSENESDNLALAKSLKAAAVPTQVLYQPEQSDFVGASPLKRGHLKIAVSTDGLCSPLERAIARRIEELFVYDFDHYSLFLSAVEEKLQAFKASNGSEFCKLNQRLEREDFYQAISRKNFEEALRLVDNHIDAIKNGYDFGDEGASSSDDEPEDPVRRPRNIAKTGEMKGGNQ